MGKCNFRVAINLVLMKDDKVLLMRRANTGWNDGKYALMGGHVEDGENPYQTAVREAKEELGIDIEPENLKPLLVMTVYPDHVYIYFGCEKFNGKIVNNEPNECDDISFFSAKKLPQNIIDADKKALNTFFSESDLKALNTIFSESDLKLDTFGYDEKQKTLV